MALAFLPSDRIQKAFDFLVADCKRVKPDKYWDKFIEYFRDEWMKIVTPEGFSVYGLDYATNNFLESLHRILTREIGKKPHPNRFIRKLKELCLRSWIQLHSCEQGNDPKFPSNPKVLEAKIQIAAWDEERKREDISDNEFVIRCASVYDDELVGDNINLDDDDSDEESQAGSESEEEPDRRMKKDEIDEEMDDVPENDNGAAANEPENAAAVNGPEKAMNEPESDSVEMNESSANSMASSCAESNRKRKSDPNKPVIYKQKRLVLSEHSYSIAPGSSLKNTAEK